MPRAVTPFSVTPLRYQFCFVNKLNELRLILFLSRKKVEGFLLVSAEAK